MRTKALKLLNPLRRQPANQARMSDVIAAYRLLLQREPDKQGLASYRDLLRRSLRTDELLSNFIHSEEFKRRTECGGFSACAAEIYSGYLGEDRDRLAALKCRGAAPTAGFYTDCFGQRFHPSYEPAIADRAGTVSSDLPLPGDGHLSEGIEYAAAGLAFEAAAGRDRFCAVELGAGWGPWTAFFGLVARRRGFRQVELAALEADTARFALLRQHLAYNGLIAGDAGDQGRDAAGLRWKLFNAAAWWRRETMLWPELDNALDAGMKAETLQAKRDRDYRGYEVGFREIAALSVPEILSDMAPVDIIHMDLQGGEAELVPNTIEFLDSQVRSIFVGTHSRKIEGDLVELMYARGWQLLREKPCKFDGGSAAPTLAGKTTIDGAQYWRNPRLA